MGFFKFSEFLAKHNIDFWNKSTLLCLVGERNVGKTTSPLNEIMDKTSATSKVFIGRLTDRQLKTQIADFNNRFAGRFIIQTNMIYKLIPYTKYNKLTESDDIFYKKGECVGYVGDVNNHHNYKSVEAKDIKFIFIDEVIQLEVIPLFYEKLINILMTFARFNKPSILLVGNRDTPNNELMVLWEIEPTETAPLEDRVTNFDENCYYVELGSEQFKDLYENDQHIVKTMAKHHQQTDLYLNAGGYLVKNAMNVLPYNKRIKETFDPKYLVTFQKRQAAVGTFNDDNLVVCIHPDAIEKANDQQLLTIPLDADGILNQESVMTSRENTDKILKMLLIEYKKGNMFCDSFELLNFLENKMKCVAFWDNTWLV